MQASQTRTTSGNVISLRVRPIVRLLAATAALLLLASVAGQLVKYLTGHDHVFGLVPLFFIDAEKNLPSGFSALLLLIAAQLLCIIAVLEKKRAGTDTGYWILLAAGFAFMAADEALAFHERLMRPMRNLLGEDLGIFHFAWVIPGIVLVLVLTPFMLRFLWRLPARTRRYFVVAAVLYLGGAIGFELVGSGFAAVHGIHNLPYTMIATVEEGLEMAGAIVFIRALLECVAARFGSVSLRVE